MVNDRPARNLEEKSLHNRIYAIFLLVGLLFMTGLIAPIAVAKPMTKEQCTGLRQLKHELETRGVAKTVQKGAKWGAANLSAAQLSEVGAFLKLGEEIRFRCGNSAVRSKKQTARKLKIALPVRNPRRLLQEKAKKKNVSVPAETVTVKTSKEMSKEVQSILSAIANKKQDAKRDTKPDSGMKKLAK